jgi:hypothetical protein
MSLFAKRANELVVSASEKAGTPAAETLVLSITFRTSITPEHPRMFGLLIAAWIALMVCVGDLCDRVTVPSVVLVECGRRDHEFIAEAEAVDHSARCVYMGRSWRWYESVHTFRRNKRQDLTTVHSPHEYQARPRKDHRGVDPISDALPFGGLWYGEPNAATTMQSTTRSFTAGHMMR